MNVEYVSSNDSPAFYKAILSIMIRFEFSPLHVNMDSHGAPHCSSSNLNIAYRYRLLLYQTRHVTAKKLVSASKQKVVYSLFHFAGGQLALLYFRMPMMRREVSEAMKKRMESPVLAAYHGPSSAPALHDPSGDSEDGDKESEASSEQSSKDPVMKSVDDLLLDSPPPSPLASRKEELVPQPAPAPAPPPQHHPMSDVEEKMLDSLLISDDTFSSLALANDDDGEKEKEKDDEGKGERDDEVDREEEEKSGDAAFTSSSSSNVPPQRSMSVLLFRTEMREKIRLAEKERKREFTNLLASRSHFLLFRMWEDLNHSLARLAVEAPENVGIEKEKGEEERIHFFNRHLPADWLVEISAVNVVSRHIEPNLLIYFFLQSWIIFILDSVSSDMEIQCLCTNEAEAISRDSSLQTLDPPPASSSSSSSPFSFAPPVPSRMNPLSVMSVLDNKNAAHTHEPSPSRSSLPPAISAEELLFDFKALHFEKRQKASKYLYGNEAYWTSYSDYPLFVSVLLKEMELNYDMLPRPLLECSCTFLLANPSLINQYIRTVFSRSNVYNTNLVLDVLAILEGWLKYLVDNEIPMPVDFDIQYLCTAFDAIMESEYHSTIQKFLTILYQHLSFFHNSARKYLFLDFFFRKHFFSLFLHWEPSIRNTFQQILVFCTLRQKRSVLADNGFIIQELGLRIPSVTPIDFSQMDDETTTTDSILFAKLESYLQMAEDQLRSPELGYYPARLQVYVPISLMEYRTYLSHYYQWEVKNTKAIPRLVSISLAREGLQNATARGKLVT